jgi:uncharacterized protein
MGQANYHLLYLRGIDHFNRQDYFESHEVWEDLWIEETGSARQFYKGLIQAAVALHHLNHGNTHGAKKLLAGSEHYLNPYRSRYMGLDVDSFLRSMNFCVNDAVTNCRPVATPALVPKIELQPPPDRGGE